MRKLSLFITISFLLLISCKKEADVSSLIKADKAFSAYSEEHGMKVAFIEFSDEGSVLLRPANPPIEGKQEIIEYLSLLSNDEYLLTWKPLKAFVSKSDDLGITYGIYTLTIKEDSSKEQGTYLTVWKRNDNGNWKYFVDTGNEGNN